MRVAGSSWLAVWLAWAVLLLLTGAWLYAAWRPDLGLSYMQWLDVRPSAVLIAALLVPMLGGIAAGSRIVIGLAGFAAMFGSWQADLLVIDRIQSLLDHDYYLICCYESPNLPLLASLGLAWLPLVLRVEAEACELLGRHASAEAMWLRGRWLALILGALLSFLIGEVAFGFAVEQHHASRGHDQWLFAIAPVLALSLFELMVRVPSREAPRFEPVASGDLPGWSAIVRPFADPVALQRGHAALRLARVIAGLFIASGLVGLWVVVDGVLDHRAWRLPWVLVSGFALIVLLITAAIPRPRPDPRRRPPEPSYGLPLRLRSLLGQLDRLRILVEHGRDGAVWELALALETELASLTDPERELLERRHAELEPLLAVLHASQSVFESLDDALRRALHAELLRFIACARGQAGEDPYREGKARAQLDRQHEATPDAALRVPSAWKLGGTALCLGLMAVAIERAPVVLVIAAPALGLLVRALALRHARRMFALAVPEDIAVQDSSPRYSVAFEQEAARVQLARRWALVISTAIAAGLCCVIAGALVRAGFDPWRWPWRWAGVRTMLSPGELLVSASVLVSALLVLAPLRDRLREWPAVAMVRRLHRLALVPRSSALIVEFVAQRLAWAEAPHAQAEALEHCAKLLCAATELNSLAAEDRECLLARLRAAIARGPALDRRQQRALELELATAERLLAS